MPDLPIRCSCGGVTGVARGITPRNANRVMCFCRGCTAYAHELAVHETLLDERGGTEVFQISPRRVEVSTGREHIACMRLTDKGALRWYASCCNSPLANTLESGRVPFVGLLHTCIDWEAVGLSREEVLGPIRVRVNKRFPPEEAKKLRATKGALLAMLAHYVPLFAWSYVRGDARHSPFFQNGRPIVPPKRVDSPFMRRRTPAPS